MRNFFDIVKIPVLLILLISFLMGLVFGLSTVMMYKSQRWSIATEWQTVNYKEAVALFESELDNEKNTIKLNNKSVVIVRGTWETQISKYLFRINKRDYIFTSLFEYVKFQNYLKSVSRKVIKNIEYYIPKEKL